MKPFASSRPRPFDRAHGRPEFVEGRRPPLRVKIRAAVTSDVRRLVELWREMWEYHKSRDERYQVTPLADTWMEDWIGRCIEDDEALVLVADAPPPVGYLLGMILQNPPVVPWSLYGHISELSVTDSHRRGGIGGRLLEAADAWFKARGCGYVEANIAVTNEAARAFWSRHGYLDFIERRRKDL